MAGPEVQPGAARRTRQRQKQKGASWLVISSTLAVLLAIRLGIYLRQPVQLPPEITPLAAPKLAELEQFKGDYEERMLWGTYRSGLYFGMRMRLPKSLLIGLMWFDPDRPDSYANIRHNAQERDGLAKYGWLRHDGASFGRQGLHDKGIRISTTMVKAHHSGSGKGGDWAVRLTGTNLDSTAEAGAQDSDGVEPPAKRRISLLFYIADEEASLHAPLRQS
ncbi:hypothetical protein WJX72_012475 [[Myrmecia] bisecta]|uniref:Mannosyl-oligosaccharide glucosidase n=1 Tax=[Myrmecia] bisecta TaxID=41462 RepID=A0AAW1QTZ6_9CHLO